MAALLGEQPWQSPLTTSQAVQGDSALAGDRWLLGLWPALASCLAKAMRQEQQPPQALMHTAARHAYTMLRYALEASTLSEAGGLGPDPAGNPEALCCAWGELYSAMDGWVAFPTVPSRQDHDSWGPVPARTSHPYLQWKCGSKKQKTFHKEC